MKDIHGASVACFGSTELELFDALFHQLLHFLTHHKCLQKKQTNKQLRNTHGYIAQISLLINKFWFSFLVTRYIEQELEMIKHSW